MEQGQIRVNLSIGNDGIPVADVRLPIDDLFSIYDGQIPARFLEAVDHAAKDCTVEVTESIKNFLDQRSGRESPWEEQA